ncbi:MAG: LptF/LptG family permease [Muribaculaceae bacterium]|nr:LptF/LptG family permease [Muribaculaceae bacterium]
MLKIKRLYLFMLKTFIPQFLMTFFICLFILMMQFLFKHINDLVGKGLTLDLLAELFFYAALTMVPLALPLAILLASLMTFGNLGEHVELTAMKASGISLTRVMKPLMVLIAAVSVGAFFFQNNVLPQTQVKMWQLLFSARQKALSLDIMEGAINSQIPGYNVYVKKKNKETDMLYKIMLYDVSTGLTYPRIVAADSGKLSMTADQKHLVLQLFNGRWYEDVKGGGNAQFGKEMYRRESFHDKEILIPYDATFTKIDDEGLKSQYIGKNYNELTQSIDSLNTRIDSAGIVLAGELQRIPVLGTSSSRVEMHDGKPVTVPVKTLQAKSLIDVDSLFGSLANDERATIASRASMLAASAQQDVNFKSFVPLEDGKVLRRHQIELQKKFTLSLACLIFFFIGAPLGAIIRKGGLGTPIVVSVLLFIVYYMIDNTGYKMARDGHWPVWQGIWLSSVVLLPLGIFLTYKAVNDSAVFNPDTYVNFFRRLFGVHQTRSLTMKEVVIDEMHPEVALQRVALVKEECARFLQDYPARQSFLTYFKRGYDKQRLRQLSATIEDAVDYLSNSREQLVINKAMDYPIVRQLLTYHITNYPRLGLAIAILLPLSIPIYIIGTRHQRNLRNDVATAVKVSDELTALLESETPN